MRFESFFRHIQEKAPDPFVEVDFLAKIVNDHHTGVGKVSFWFFEDFPEAQWGNFIWLEEQRTSPYEEPYHDAMIFINDRFRDDRAYRRMVAAKELMHVFDDSDRRAGTPDTFIRLVSDIVNNPLLEDASEPYRADRAALWKAMVALVPPWLRQQAIDTDHPPEYWADRWLVPLPVVGGILSDYYPHIVSRFTSPN